MVLEGDPILPSFDTNRQFLFQNLGCRLASPPVISSPLSSSSAPSSLPCAVAVVPPPSTAPLFLCSLESALTVVKHLELDDKQQAQAIALHQAAAQCRVAIDSLAGWHSKILRKIVRSHQFSSTHYYGRLCCTALPARACFETAGQLYPKATVRRVCRVVP